MQSKTHSMQWKSWHTTSTEYRQYARSLELLSAHAWRPLFIMFLCTRTRCMTIPKTNQLTTAKATNGVKTATYRAVPRIRKHLNTEEQHQPQPMFSVSSGKEANFRNRQLHMTQLYTLFFPVYQFAHCYLFSVHMLIY